MGKNDNKKSGCSSGCSTVIAILFILGFIGYGIDSCLGDGDVADEIIEKPNGVIVAYEKRDYVSAKHTAKELAGALYSVCEKYKDKNKIIFYPIIEGENSYGEKLVDTLDAVVRDKEEIKEVNRYEEVTDYMFGLGGTLMYGRLFKEGYH